MRLKWTQFALQQLDELLDAIEERRGASAAKKQALEVITAAARLRDLPRLGAPWRLVDDERFRRLVVEEHVVIYCTYQVVRLSEARSYVTCLAWALHGGLWMTTASDASAGATGLERR